MVLIPQILVVIVVTGIIYGNSRFTAGVLAMLLAMAGVITAAYLIYEARRMEVDLKFLSEQHLFWQSCKSRLASPDFFMVVLGTGIWINYHMGGFRFWVSIWCVVVKKELCATVV